MVNRKYFSALFYFFILILINLFFNLINIYHIGNEKKCDHIEKDIFLNNSDFRLKRKSKNSDINNLRLFDIDENVILDFEGFDYENGTDRYIVPNIFHLIYLNSPNIKFYQAINIYSIFLNHRPDLIIIHCDNCSFWGYYWNEIQSIEELRKIVILNKLPTIKSIFDKKYKFIQHRADIWRLLILMHYGGIYLDNDVYVIKSLNEFRKYEMVLSIERNWIIGNQVLIAHKNARFLKAVYDSYRTKFNASSWYYNGGVVPGEILKENPKLAKIVPNKFGVQILFSKLYKRKNWNEWRTFYTIHLLMNHRRYGDKDSTIRQFNEANIIDYPYTYGEMARLILALIKPYKPNVTENTLL